MSMEWYRMYHGMPFDTKLRVVAKRADQPMGLVVAVWACMLDAASTNDSRGIAVIDPEEIAVALDFDLEVIEAILSAMRDKQMLDENSHLTAWDTPDGVLLQLECPRPFVRDWIEKHYLTDLNHCWDEQTTCSRSVVGVQLTSKEKQS